MALILLRHTAPACGTALCYGRTEVPLAPGFPAEAAAVEAGLPPLDAVATSPAGRARALADHIAASRGLAAHADSRLAELDFGRWEGLPWDAVPRAELDAWAADLLHARPHGGESVAMLQTRVAAALEEYRRRPGTVLLVTHAGVVRAARVLAGEAGAWQSRIGWGEWLRL